MPAFTQTNSNRGKRSTVWIGFCASWPSGNAIREYSGPEVLLPELLKVCASTQDHHAVARRHDALA